MAKQISQTTRLQRELKSLKTRASNLLAQLKELSIYELFENIKIPGIKVIRLIRLNNKMAVISFPDVTKNSNQYGFLVYSNANLESVFNTQISFDAEPETDLITLRLIFNLVNYTEINEGIKTELSKIRQQHQIKVYFICDKFADISEQKKLVNNPDSFVFWEAEPSSKFIIDKIIGCKLKR